MKFNTNKIKRYEGKANNLFGEGRDKREKERERERERERGGGGERGGGREAGGGGGLWVCDIWMDRCMNGWTYRCMSIQTGR